MNEERRSHERVTTNLRARWKGVSGSHEGRVEDVSLGGCFINTAARADIGEVIGLEMQLPSGEWLHLHGEVTFYQEGIGLGLVLNSLTYEEKSVLRELVFPR